jgi:hypothetical protein
MPGVAKAVGVIEEYVYDIIDALKKDAIRQVQEVSNVRSDARPVRPDDLGGTAEEWQTTATAATAVRVYGGAADQQVNVGNAFIFFGWYCPEDFDTNGAVRIQIEGITRNVISAQFAFNQPGHVAYTFDQVVFLPQNTTFNCHLENNQAAAITSGGGPIGYRVGPPKQLLIE